MRPPFRSTTALREALEQAIRLASTSAPWWVATTSKAHATAQRLLEHLAEDVRLDITPEDRDRIAVAHVALASISGRIRDAAKERPPDAAEELRRVLDAVLEVRLDG